MNNRANNTTHLVVKNGKLRAQTAFREPAQRADTPGSATLALSLLRFLLRGLVIETLVRGYQGGYEESSLWLSY